jgi:hypothetical protein
MEFRILASLELVDGDGAIPLYGFRAAGGAGDPAIETCHSAGSAERLTAGWQARRYPDWVMSTEHGAR